MLSTFYRQLEDAFGPTGTATAQSRALSLAQAGYGRPNPGRRYPYFRASAKDPFDWIYFTPAVTVIANLDDGSAQFTPELVYTGWQDVELRARTVRLRGAEYSDFGEKPVDRRLELRVRLFF